MSEEESRGCNPTVKKEMFHFIAYQISELLLKGQYDEAQTKFDEFKNMAVSFNTLFP